MPVSLLLIPHTFAQVYPHSSPKRPFFDLRRYEQILERIECGYRYAERLHEGGAFSGGLTLEEIDLPADGHVRELMVLPEEHEEEEAGSREAETGQQRGEQSAGGASGGGYLGGYLGWPGAAARAVAMAAMPKSGRSQQQQ